MKKEYITPEVMMCMVGADCILAGVSVEVKDVETEEQYAKQYTWGNLWEDDDDLEEE